MSNINKLLEDRVGLVIRWMPYSELPEFETYSNCRGIFTNFQIQWTVMKNSSNCLTPISDYDRELISGDYHAALIMHGQSIPQDIFLATEITNYQRNF